MSNTSQPTAIPTPALLVFGKPTSPDLPQASWFRAEDRPTVVAAAQSLKFSVLDISTDAERALAVGVHEGVLKGNGRMIVGSVAPEVYQRIEDYAVNAAQSRIVKVSSDKAAETKPLPEQNMNSGDKAPSASHAGKPEAALEAADPWAALRVGSHVVAKHWNGDGAPDGWWIAVITAINGSHFVIRWPDEPKTSPLKIERKHVALLHPDFDVAREWDRKPHRRN